MPTKACQAVVSIQRFGLGDAIERHLSWAVQIDVDCVLVPGPLDWLRDPEVDFEVLLASGTRSGPTLVERIRPVRAQIVAAQGAPDGAVAAIWLERASVNRPVVHELVDAAFVAAVETEPDLWRAFESTGVIDAGMLRLPVDVVLAPVVVWERARRSRLVRRDLVLAPHEMPAIFCCWLMACWRCHDCGSWWT